MIKNRAAYQRLRVDEDRKTLQALSLTASIAAAEALLTSSIMDARGPRSESRPISLARGLGIRPSRLRRAARPPR